MKVSDTTKNDKKIAIIGAGISGLAAAWSLKRAGFDVAVFEKETECGGHITQVQAELDNKPININVGSEILYDNYYNLLAFLFMHDLPFQTRNSSIFVETSDHIRWGQSNRNWQKLNKGSGHIRQYENEFNQLFRELKYLYLTDAGDTLVYQSVDSFLYSRKYSEEFIQNYLLPILQVLLITDSPNEALSYSSVILPEMTNSRLLDPISYIPNLVIEGGMKSLVDCIVNFLGDALHTQQAVDRVEISSSGPIIHLEGAPGKKFDEVVFAIGFDKVAKLLSNPSKLAGNIFRQYQSRTTEIVIHQDTSVIPVSAPVDDNFSVFSVDGHYTVDWGRYWYHNPRKVFGTVINRKNPAKIDPSKIFAQKTFTWENFVPYSIAGKQYVRRIQGENQLWYCGLSTIMGFSELCFASGLVIAEKLGATYPFEGYLAAEKVYSKVKQFMSDGHWSLSWFSNY